MGLQTQNRYSRNLRPFFNLDGTFGGSLLSPWWSLGAVTVDTAFSNLKLIWENPYNFTRNEARDSNWAILESLDHFSFPSELWEVLYQIHGGFWGPKSRYHIYAFLTYSWENPFNFTRKGATDSTQAFLESSDHF